MGRSSSSALRAAEAPCGVGGVDVGPDGRVALDVEGEHALFFTNADGAITYVNRAFERVYGLSCGDILGRVPHVVSADSVHLALDQELWAKVATPQTVALEVARPGRPGSAVHITGTASPVIDDHGDVVGFIGLGREGRKGEPRPLAHAYRGAFEQNPIPTWIVDIETLRFLVVNDAAVAQYGYSRADFLAMTIADIREEKEVPELKARLAQRELGSTDPGVWRHRKKDGSALEVQITSQLFEFHGRRCLFVSAQNITEQRRIEDQFLQAQKLEAVGRLVGSVAHDFNNLLSIILGCATLAKENLPADGQTWMDIEEIEKAAGRAATLTGQLLAFSRREVREPKPVAVGASIFATSKMLKRLLGETIELEVSLGPDLWPIRIAPGHIDQVLMNLAVNARDAMPSGGKLTIDAANVILDEMDLQQLHGAHAGPHVRISAIDTGTGMTSQVQKRAFEPFFTTKEVGRGTGLGLATVFQIVRQCGGSIRLQSEVGAGTRFDVYLPRYEPIAEDGVAEASLTKTVAGGGTETILIVEDDDQLRRLLEKVLRKQGYETLAAGNPNAARELVEQHGGRLDLLLTDVVMPVMNGSKLATALRTRRPSLRVLYMSGYEASALAEQGIVLDDGATLLHKPITPEALVRSVRMMLDQPVARCPG